MCEHDGPKPGEIAWRDLTVADAESVRDFYEAVVGWKAEAVEMDGYADFAMVPPGGGGAVAGICHARGPNTGLPPQWLLYVVVVADVDAATALAVERGGAVVAPPRAVGGGRMAVVRDPAGAVCGLWQNGG